MSTIANETAISHIQTVQAHEPAPHLGHLPLNCPKCGQCLIYVRARNGAGYTIADSNAVDEHTVYVYHCARDGPFRFSRTIPVRAGD
jgi:hypothetical protein